MKLHTKVHQETTRDEEDEGRVLDNSGIGDNLGVLPSRGKSTRYGRAGDHAQSEA